MGIEFYQKKWYKAILPIPIYYVECHRADHEAVQWVIITHHAIWDPINGIKNEWMWTSRKITSPQCNRIKQMKTTKTKTKEDLREHTVGSPVQLIQIKPTWHASVSWDHTRCALRRWSQWMVRTKEVKKRCQ